MRNKILSSTLAIVFLTSQGHASERSFKSDTDLETWYSGYYLSPSPSRAIDALLYYGKSPLYEKETSRDQLAIFIGTIIKGNPDILEPAYQALTTSGNENSKIFFLNVLWFADTVESRELIQKAEIDWSSPDIFETGEWLLKNPTFDVLNEPTTQAHHLDLLWSIFLATGDDVPVRKIISTLKFLDNKSPELVIVGGAARWSLKSNAELHPKIIEICKQEIKGARGTTKKVLSEILAQK